MTQPHVAEGPLEVARTDPPHRAPGGHAGPRLDAIFAALSLVGRVLLGALIVEAIAVASFGVGVGTVAAVLGAVALLVGWRVGSGTSS